MGKAASLTRIAITYLVAIAAGGVWIAAGPSTGRFWLDTLVADLIATMVVFAGSRIHHNSSFYDPYWSLIPPLLALLWWSRHATGADGLRFWSAFALILIWSTRLTANWAQGFPGLHHEDWRYPMLRERAGRAELLVDLLGIHAFPTVQVMLAMLPVYLVTARSGRGFGTLDVVALTVGLAAIVLETVADLQLRHFVRRHTLGQALDAGVWAWSRHPNYFGELSFWAALALFGLAADPHAWWWMFAGLAAMLAMFLGASIPMMEQRSLERRPEYQDVIERVPRFVPRPPATSQDAPG